MPAMRSVPRLTMSRRLAAGTFSLSRGKNTLLLNYEAGYSFDDAAPVERWFELGGFARLSGLVPDQLSGRQLGLFSLVYLRRLNNIDILPAYAGISLEAGNVWNYADDVSFGDLRKSGSIFVGAETPLGPVYLAWGYSDSGDNTSIFTWAIPSEGKCKKFTAALSQPSLNARMFHPNPQGWVHDVS